MIFILDASLKRQGVIQLVDSAAREESINGINTLELEANLNSKLSLLITEDSILEVNNDYFDIAYIKKEVNESNDHTIEIQAEHISYRLNDPQYNVEFFTEMGTPSYILTKILEGTPFTFGYVESTEYTVYSAQEPKSRRQLLMEFVAFISGEVVFSQFDVSILSHRGSIDPIPTITGKNVNLISKIVDKRKRDQNGNPLVSYTCRPMYLPGDKYELGDNIILINSDLGISEALRLVSISVNPYNESETTLQFATYNNGLAETLYRTQLSTVIKDRLYNGTRIGPEFGFEAVRNDKMARAYFRSDGMKFQTGDGTGNNWMDRLYYDYDSVTNETILVFDGVLSAYVIEALKAEIDIVVSNTIITNVLAADTARIAELTVDSIETSDKVQRYKLRDTNPTVSKADVNYFKGDDQSIQFITAETDGLLTEHVKDRFGTPLYWLDATETQATDNVTAWPVTQWKYDEMVKMELSFREINGVYRPLMVLGSGYGSPQYPDRGKFFIDKDPTAGYLEYIKGDGTSVKLSLGEDGVKLPQEYYKKLTDLDFYNNGFRAAYDTEAISYRWIKDEQGRITQLIDVATGANVIVAWNAGDL